MLVLLASSKWFVLALAGALLILLLILRNRNTPRSGLDIQKAQPVAQQKRGVQQISVVADGVPHVKDEPQTVLDIPAKNSIEVVEADPLAEAAVYLEFGYFEPAAQALRSYIDGPGAANKDVMRKLLQIYLRLQRIDDYADVLERLWDAADDPDFVHAAILRGLEADVDNLHLRVLAEAHFNLGPEQINKLLGIDEVDSSRPLADDESANRDVDVPVDMVSTHASHPQVPQRVSQRRLFQLIEGGSRLDSSFSHEEKAMLRVFSHPAHEARLHRAEARVHRAAGNWEEAMSALRQAISVRPQALVNFADLLWVLHRQKRLDEYAHTLWHLYSVLNGAGRALRERFLGMGLVLGQHRIFDALLNATERRHIDEIGKHYGLLPQVPLVSNRLHLVESHSNESTEDDAVLNGGVLDEVNSYLEFGQIDEAIEVLESAVVSDPGDAELYPLLFDLYDRMNALDRFMALAVKIKRIVQRPPDEVVPMMLALQQRLQQRKQASRRAKG